METEYTKGVGLVKLMQEEYVRILNSVIIG